MCVHNVVSDTRFQTAHWIVDQIEYFKSNNEKKNECEKRRVRKRQTNRSDHDYMYCGLSYIVAFYSLFRFCFFSRVKVSRTSTLLKNVCIFIGEYSEGRELIAWDEFEYISSILFIYAIYAYSQTRQCPIVGPWIMAIMCASLGKRVSTWRIPCIFFVYLEWKTTILVCVRSLRWNGRKANNEQQMRIDTNQNQCGGCRIFPFYRILFENI